MTPGCYIVVVVDVYVFIFVDIDAESWISGFHCVVNDVLSDLLALC